MTGFLEFFSDPFLRAPTLASMLMGAAAALMGVFLFVQKRSLVGETLAHATYPGVILSIVIGAFLNVQQEWQEVLLLIVGAFFSAFAGYGLLHYLRTKKRVSSDATLCFVLTSFFGLGVLWASSIQFSHTQAYRRIFAYLYGQVATMRDGHIVFFGIFFLLVMGYFFFFYKELQLLSFDRSFTKAQGIPVKMLENLGWILVVLSIVVGIRSVGVVLMSAMFIAPACAARQLTHRLSTMLWMACLFGLLSGFFGNYLSFSLAEWTNEKTGEHLSLPTGPTIVLVASFLALLSLFFAPRQGILARQWRIWRFQWKCREENLLKILWREETKREETLWVSACASQGLFFWGRIFFYHRFIRKGWMEKRRPGWVRLLPKGKQEGARIVRLHRLWEVYLVKQLGEESSRVHGSAETMEHILTKEHESELTKLLCHPVLDPHLQPIPPLEEKAHGSAS